MGVADGVEGDVAARDIAEERVEDASQRLKVGDTIEAKFTGMDRKGRSLQLSIKAKAEAEPAETLAEYSKASSSSDASTGTTRLGALLSEQLEHQSESAVMRWPGSGLSAALHATTTTVSMTESKPTENTHQT